MNQNFSESRTQSIAVRASLIIGGSTALVILIIAPVLYFIETSQIENNFLNTGYSLLENFNHQSKESITKGHRVSFQHVMDNIAKVKDVQESALYTNLGYMNYKSGVRSVGIPFAVDPETGAFKNPNKKLWEETNGTYRRPDWSLVDWNDTPKGKKHIAEKQAEKQQCHTCHFTLPKDQMTFTEENQAHVINKKSIDFFYKIPVTKDCLTCHTNWKTGDPSGYLKLTISKDRLSEQKRDVLTGLAGIILAMGIPTFLILGFVFRSYIYIPLNKFVDNMKELLSGEGDLSIRLPVKENDEIGQMAFWFNNFVEKISEVLAGVVSNMETLSEHSEELSTSSEEMAAKADRVTKRSHDSLEASNKVEKSIVATMNTSQEVSEHMVSVSSSVEELSSNIESIAAASTEAAANMQGVTTNTDQIANSIQGVSAATEELSASLREINKNTSSAVEISDQTDDAANRTLSSMKELDDASRKAGQIVQLIASIATQTNMLALNATIEAASAGESGKGFTVVASEVKTLAAQTASANQQIGKQIEQIQDFSNQSFEATQNINQAILKAKEINNTIAQSVSEQTASVAETSQLAESIAFASRQSAQNVKEAAAGLEEITRSSEEAAKAANYSSKAVSDVSQAVKGIAEESAKAAEAVTLSHSLVTESQHEIEEIRKDIQSNTTRAGSLTELALTLKKLVGFFKVN